MIRISGFIAEMANKKEEDDASLAELEQLFNMRLCDIKPPSLVTPRPPRKNLPRGSSRKRTHEPQPKSMMFPKSAKRKKPHRTRLDGTLSEIQKGLAYEPKDREW